jgi:hypothetical protein
MKKDIDVGSKKNEFNRDSIGYREASSWLGRLVASISLCLIVIGLVIVVPTSCKVSFVPASSQGMITQVQNATDFTDELYNQMASSTDKSYATWRGSYIGIDSIITSILSQDSVRAKSGVLLSQVALLQKNFRILKNYHQSQGILNNSQLRLYQSQLDAFWQAILVSEKSYK